MIINSFGLYENSLLMFLKIIISRSRNNTTPSNPKLGLKNMGLYHHPSIPGISSKSITRIPGTRLAGCSVKQINS